MVIIKEVSSLSTGHYLRPEAKGLFSFDPDTNSENSLALLPTQR